jgi:Transglutaminase-like superfamily/TAT (twin-arginine translocation) pathway signal sequence
MDRRQFLKSAAAASATLALPRVGRALGQATADANWRTFEVTTRVELLNPSGPSLVWLPAAQLQASPYQKTLTNAISAEGGTAELVPYDGFGIVTGKYPAGSRPVLTLTSRVSTRNYSVDLAASEKTAKLDAAEAEKCLQASRVVPIDGIVKTTADSITLGQTSDVAKARAIYEWIVDNTFRNPKTRGCGLGDIRYMLEAQDLSGKCADLNALYVGLARAALRFLGNELDGLQLRRRRSAARLDASAGQLLHVSPGGDRRGPRGPVRSGQVQVRDHGQRADGGLVGSGPERFRIPLDLRTDSEVYTPAAW